MKTSRVILCIFILSLMFSGTVHAETVKFHPAQPLSESGACPNSIQLTINNDKIADAQSDNNTFDYKIPADADAIGLVKVFPSSVLMATIHITSKIKGQRSLTYQELMSSDESICQPTNYTETTAK